MEGWTEEDGVVRIVQRPDSNRRPAVDDVSPWASIPEGGEGDDLAALLEEDEDASDDLDAIDANAGVRQPLPSHGAEWGSVDTAQRIAAMGGDLGLALGVRGERRSNAVEIGQGRGAFEIYDGPTVSVRVEMAGMSDHRGQLLGELGEEEVRKNEEHGRFGRKRFLGETAGGVLGLCPALKVGPNVTKKQVGWMESS